jgi:hypothetical protein
MAVGRGLGSRALPKILVFQPLVVAVPFPRCLNQIVREMTVVYAFDTLGYAKRLRDGGVSNPQAEAHAEAARDFIMIELVTKQDLQSAIDTQTLRLTVRLGGIVAAGVGVLGAAMGMLALFLRLH